MHYILFITYYLLSLYRVTLIRLRKMWQSLLSDSFCSLNTHALLTWQMTSWHVRCGTSRPTYANERNVQDMHMTLEKSRNQAYVQKSPFIKTLSLEYSSNTCDRHATEIYVANTWVKGRSAYNTWPQVLQWLNSTENHSTLYVLIGVSPPWNYASFLWRTY